MLLCRVIIHDGNPVLRWIAGNVVVETDAAGNIKVTKARLLKKTNDIVVSVMVVDRTYYKLGFFGERV